jgi:hypothetical protein
MDFAPKEAQKLRAIPLVGLRGNRPLERVQVQILPASDWIDVSKTMAAAFGPQTTAPNQ